MCTHKHRMACSCLGYLVRHRTQRHRTHWWVFFFFFIPIYYLDKNGIGERQRFLVCASTQRPLHNVFLSKVAIETVYSSPDSILSKMLLNSERLGGRSNRLLTGRCSVIIVAHSSPSQPFNVRPNFRKLTGAPALGVPELNWAAYRRADSRPRDAECQSTFSLW